MGKDVTYLCDPCCRGGVPPFELQMNLISNLAEIMWEGADGKLVEPQYAAKFGAQFILTSDWASTNPLLVEFPEKYRNQIKLHYATMFGKQVWIMPQGGVEIGSVVTYGDSLDSCFEQAKEIADEIKGTQIECLVGSMDGLKKNLETFEQFDVKFE